MRKTKNIVLNGTILCILFISSFGFMALLGTLWILPLLLLYTKKAGIITSFNLFIIYSFFSYVNLQGNIIFLPIYLIIDLITVLFLLIGAFIKPKGKGWRTLLFLYYIILFHVISLFFNQLLYEVFNIYINLFTYLLYLFYSIIGAFFITKYTQWIKTIDKLFSSIEDNTYHYK